MTREDRELGQVADDFVQIRLGWLDRVRLLFEHYRYRRAIRQAEIRQAREMDTPYNRMCDQIVREKIASGEIDLEVTVADIDRFMEERGITSKYDYPQGDGDSGEGTRASKARKYLGNRR